MKQKIDTFIYGYNPNEFMPVWRDNKLDNRSEFVAYKAKRAMQYLGQVISKTAEVTVEVVGVLQD